MKLTDFIKKIIIDYFIIFAIVVMSITILRQIFFPDEYFKLKDIFIYMISSLVGALPGLIFYSSKEISEKEMKIRMIVHFVVLEAALLTFGNIIDFVNGILDTILFAFQIAIIYILVRFFSWMDDRKAARRINEKLKDMKGISGDGLKEE